MDSYYITGVWKDNNGRITDVMLHLRGEDNIFHKGVKTSETDVILLIDNGDLITTLTWSYQNVAWQAGAKVIVPQGRRKLRTVAKKSDDLDNLINMKAFI